ncbi:MAG: PilN domain-containing protein [Candidatus Eremiobacteraeota bacterium]|nr:PilN domain-containing protein [Candidatus Eremiobacteraeota bacterium]
MRRINYLPSWSERNIGIALPVAVAELRAPLVALAGAVALAGVLWGVQSTRHHAAERDGAAYAERLAATQFDVARVRAVERDVARLTALGERVDTIHRSGALHANEIATLGNRLPPDAWLSSLRADRGTLAVEGHGARLAAVGTTIASLAALPAYRTARLVAVHEDPVRSGVTYALSLEPKP